MTAARFTKHRPVALAIAKDWRIPGMDADDVRQEALVALWEACGSYDPSLGRFPSFAATVIRRHLTDLLRAATALKRTVSEDRDTEPADQRDRLAARLELVELARRLPSLSTMEREAVADHLNGSPAKASKSHDSALDRARRKLRSAA